MRQFHSTLLADTASPIIVANSLALAIKPEVEERKHGTVKQSNSTAIETSSLEQGQTGLPNAVQSMGEAYLLPAIAAVVLGGTSMLGGRGSYLGTDAGVMLITLLQPILSVMQIPEFGRQIIYGLVIIAMLLLHGRERLLR